MRRTTLALALGSAIGLPAFAESALDCIHPDVREGLMYLTPDSDQHITPEAPAAIAALPAPASFEWIAASDRSGTLFGAYKTRDDADTALAAALDAVAAQGWAPDSRALGGQPFSLSPMEITHTVCNEGEALTLTARRVGDVTYMLYSRPAPALASRSSCAVASQPLAQLSALDPDMPQLDLSAIDPNAMLRGASGSGGSDRSSRSTQIRLDAALGDVSSELARQMSQQGWAQDAAWLGSVSAGSVWQRSEGNRQLTAHLDIVDAGHSSYIIDIQLAELQ